MLHLAQFHGVIPAQAGMTLRFLNLPSINRGDR
jgi:hypothetical protein